MPPTKLSYRIAAPLGTLFFLFVTALEAHADALLHCEVRACNQIVSVRTRATDNPYVIPAIPIGESFRFKAVMIGDKERIEYIKLYSYYYRQGEYPLLHQASYPQPPAAASSSAAKHFTGQVTLYSPKLERELSYQCSLLED